MRSARETDQPARDAQPAGATAPPLVELHGLIEGHNHRPPEGRVVVTVDGLGRARGQHLDQLDKRGLRLPQ
eukprot:8997110-Lingulodinium_polyedra.AAC.1